MAGTFPSRDTTSRWTINRNHTSHNTPIRPGTPLRNEISFADLSLDQPQTPLRLFTPTSSPRILPVQIISEPSEMRSSPRKFSYASVREESGKSRKRCEVASRLTHSQIKTLPSRSSRRFHPKNSRRLNGLLGRAAIGVRLRASVQPPTTPLMRSTYKHASTTMPEPTRGS
jgi:hypothetical protein